MASGDNVVKIIDVMPTDADQATIDYRLGGSTPGEEVLVRDFDDTTIEYVDYKCYLDGYDGGGLTIVLPWSSEDQTSGNVKWDVAIRAIPDDAEDIDGGHAYQYNTVTDVAPSASGEVVYPTVTFTDGADMDSWADGEIAIVRVRRDTGVGGNMTNDAELWAMVGKET